MTPKQQAFAEEYAKDHNGKAAATRAGYSERTAEPQASRLLRNVKVRAHVNRIEAAAAERVEITVAGISARLQRIADKAEAMGGPSALSVARQAMMDVAKLNGLVVETQETISRSPEERRARLASLKAERDRITRAH